ncbi:MAG TPA: serine protease [Bacteroidales bacterium]|nr:serine protease [Bacteroidales bacterium]
MQRLFTILFIYIICFGSVLKADEGMWLLPMIEKLNLGRMTDLGLRLSVNDIYSINNASLKDAVVSFMDGGCTGEIVSSQGLLLTNHHCGYGMIQAHSTLENNYLNDGFWAMTREEELPNPGLSVSFLIKIEDVTDKVLAGLKPEMTESERTDAINAARRSIENSASSGTGYGASVSAFYGGNYFYLIVYERYTDVRLVGAPPSSIGSFGDDTDNWEWPRHTGDFSMFRVYSGPDGKPAPYSKDNIPLNPKRWLKISLKELNEGDFTMVMGYPGRTQRYYTSWEVNELLKITNPNRIKIRGIKQESWMKDMLADPKVNIQYASKYSGSANYWKYSIGQNNQLISLGVIDKKREIENRFDDWINEDPSRKTRYGEALKLIRTSIEGRSEYQNAYQYLTECTRGCEIFDFINYTGRLKEALKSGDLTKITEAAMRLKNITSELYKDFNPHTDLKTTKIMLRLYRDDVPPIFHPDFYTEVIDKKFKGNIEKFVDDMFRRSIFAGEERLNAFLNNPKLKILEKDPVAITVKSINEIRSILSGELGKYENDLSAGRRLWIAALREMMPDKTLYPDANSTMRLSYGTIQNYDPRDAVTYKYYTTLDGKVDKYKPGDYEFDLPQRFLDLYERKEFGRYASSRGYMPVNFLTTNDITGGNSGSPVLNSHGELIGLAFDGNWEAMSGDVFFEPEVQRTIAVDIRYVLWIIDIYAGATHLVEEMTIAE